MTTVAVAVSAAVAVLSLKGRPPTTADRRRTAAPLAVARRPPSRRSPAGVLLRDATHHVDAVHDLIQAVVFGLPQRPA
ncbi:MAG: hypothetical protein K1X50_09440, partial [Candidatus Promineofilum sp.]|nr:hypothetical protein [Promineifilum sp.]